MSSGIISIDLAQAGWARWSSALLGVALVIWSLLALSGELARQLAGVPATGVLATRLLSSGWSLSSEALTITAAVLLVWHLRRYRPPDAASGIDLLPVVAIQSVGIAVSPWWRPATVVLLVAGLLLYLRVITRFRLDEVVRGGGDQWIAGGALAISCLAAADAGLHTVAVALWTLAMAWLPVLVAGELAHPRRGTVERRWATVFPIGMYAAMSNAVGGVPRFAHLDTAAAAVAWALVLAFTVVEVGRQAANSGPAAR